MIPSVLQLSLQNACDPFRDGGMWSDMAYRAVMDFPAQLLDHSCRKRKVWPDWESNLGLPQL
jgi:hypothetical protein